MSEEKTVRVGIMSFMNIYMGSITEEVYKILVEKKSQGEVEVDIPEEMYNKVKEAYKKCKAAEGKND